MLERTSIAEVPFVEKPVAAGQGQILGTRLQRRLKLTSQTRRALTAYDLRTGAEALVYLSPRQAARVTGSRLDDVYAVMTATPLELAALRAGEYTVDALRREQVQHRRRNPKVVKAFIQRVGADVVLAALDENDGAGGDAVMNKRHGWEPTADHFYPGPKHWRCIKCGLLKVTEWDEKPTYHWHDGRTWKRFAPPCPPSEEPKG